MIFNKIELLEKVGGLNELLKEMVSIYLIDADQSYRDVKAALQEKNYAKLSETSHAVKGAALSICAEDYGNIAARLENAGPENAEDLDDLEHRFDQEYTKLNKILREILE